MNTLEYIAAVKAACGIESDYALAQRLGITRSYMSKLRTGRETMSNNLARQFAEILGMHPGIVMLDAEKERAADDDMRSLWEEIAKGFHVPSQGKTRSGRHRPTRL